MVEFLIDAWLDYAAVAQRERGFRDDGGFDALAEVGQLVDCRVQGGQASAELFIGRSDWRGLRGRVGRGHMCIAAAQTFQCLADRRQPGQGSGQGQDVARVGGFERDPAEQALQVQDAIQRPAQFFARDGCFYLSLDGIETGVDFRDVDRRAQQPGAQQAFAHGRNRGVDRAEQRDARIGAGSRTEEERLDQLQVAHGDGIEHQAGLTLVESDAVDVAESSALGGADVIKNGAGGGRGCRLAGEAEAFERQHSKMVFQQRDGVVGGEDPIVQRGFGIARGD